MSDTYLFHQTPEQCAKDLIAQVPLQEGDRVLEPFRGEGAFFNNFPSFVEKDWAEITQGRDFKDIVQEFDWVISNPPFRLETGSSRVNSFYYLLDYYSRRAKKGIAFLGNDYCLATLTPKRLDELRSRGWSITKIVVCCVKKWRGRYFFVILEKDKPSVVSYLLPTY
jgi:hypothetical protein